MKSVALLICLFVFSSALRGQEKPNDGSGKAYEPVGILAGKSGGTIARETAAAAPILEASLMRFDIDIQYKVVSFKLLISKGGSDIEFVSQSNQLTSQMRSAITGLLKGQSMIFKDIKASGPDNKIINVKPLVLKIE